MKVNYLLFVMAYCLLCAPLSKAQVTANVVGRDNQIDNPIISHPMQLTIKVVGETYCEGDSELDGLRLDVLFKYTNVGTQPLIVYKGSNLVSRTMVSRNMDDARAKRFELNSTLTQVTSGGDECFTGPVPNKCFAILTPNSSYEVQGVVGIFVLRETARRIDGAIESGNHVLQAEVVTWPTSNELAKKLSKLWEQSGSLWYRPVVTEPIQFDVKKERCLVDCP